MKSRQILELNESVNLTSSFGFYDLNLFDNISCEIVSTDGIADGFRKSSIKSQVLDIQAPFSINFSTLTYVDHMFLNNSVNNITLQVIASREPFHTVICTWNATNYTLGQSCGIYPCSSDMINITSIGDNWTTYYYSCWANSTSGNTSQTETREVKFGAKIYSCDEAPNTCNKFQLYDNFNKGVNGSTILNVTWGLRNWSTPVGYYLGTPYNGCIYSNEVGNNNIKCGDQRWSQATVHNVWQNKSMTCKVSVLINSSAATASAWMYGKRSDQTETWYTLASDGVWETISTVPPPAHYVSTGVSIVPNVWWDVYVTHYPLGDNCSYYIFQQNNGSSWNATNFGCHTGAGNNTFNLTLGDVGGGDGSLEFYTNMSCWNGSVNDKPLVQ